MSDDNSARNLKSFDETSYRHQVELMNEQLCWANAQLEKQREKTQISNFGKDRLFEVNRELLEEVKYLRQGRQPQYYAAKVSRICKILRVGVREDKRIKTRPLSIADELFLSEFLHCILENECFNRTSILHTEINKLFIFFNLVVIDLQLLPQIPY